MVEDYTLWPVLPKLRCLACGITWTSADLDLLQAAGARHTAQSQDCTVVVVP